MPAARIREFVENYDAERGLPRPVDQLHATSHEAAVMLVRVSSRALINVFMGTAAATCVLWGGSNFRLSGYWYLLACLVALGVLLFSAAEAAWNWRRFYGFLPPSSHGTARWMTANELQRRGYARESGSPGRAGELLIGTVGRKYELVLPPEAVMRQTIIFGLTGSGKSESFLKNILTCWAAGGGSVVALDPKGELYAHAADHYRNVYRLDLVTPTRSDRWNFIPDCRGNLEMARELASLIVGKGKGKDADSHWTVNARSLLTAVLLHLANRVERPTPRMLSDFLVMREPKALAAELAGSEDRDVRIQAGPFTTDTPDNQRHILTGAMTKFQTFELEHARQITTHPTERELRLGVKLIDFRRLREPGTALFVVVQEGQAAEYETFITTFFGHAQSVMRKCGGGNAERVLFVFDEAGNVPLVDLSETLSVGRGRGIGVVLGYQNISQLRMHYGADQADAILGSVGTRIFLPGCNYQTARYAAEEIGRSTVVSRVVGISPEGGGDEVREVETARHLIDAAEIRQLAEFKRMIVLTGTLPPIKATFPPLPTRGRGVVPPEYPPAVSVGYEEALRTCPVKRMEAGLIQSPPAVAPTTAVRHVERSAVTSAVTNAIGRPLKCPPDGRPIAERIKEALALAGYLSTRQIIDLCFSHLSTENARKSKASSALGELERGKEIKSQFFQREKIYYSGKAPNPRQHDLAVRRLLVKILKSGYEIGGVKLSSDLNDLMPDLEVSFLTEGGQLNTYWEYDAGTERNKELLSKLERYDARGADDLVTFVFETEKRLETFLGSFTGRCEARFAVLDEITGLDQPVFRRHAGGAGMGSNREQFFKIRPYLVTAIK
jgi:type IV secretory pathway TraG/TraD family ATPase VirD4